jgi:hypothetical protein
MKNLLFAFVLLIICSTSCKKADQSTQTNINATIMDTGFVLSDGCGWLIKIDASGTSYHADNLPINYQKDKLPVIISYHLLNTKFSCGLLSNNISVIKIDAIKNN